MGLILLVVTVILCFSFSIAQVGSFGYYKSTYDSLVNGTAVFDYQYGGLYYFCDPNEKGRYTSEIVIFTNGDGTLKDIKVGPCDYIHGGALSYLSPYTLYWWFKYRDWFEKNKERFVTLK
jgi:hypothetical protein